MWKKNFAGHVAFYPPSRIGGVLVTSRGYAASRCLTVQNVMGETKMFRKNLILVAALLAGTSVSALAQTVTPLTNGPPFDGVVYGFLLTDGSILYQGGLLNDWYRFRPDKTGSYVNGTYYPAAGLPPDYIPYATSGGVLPDGRVLLIGGEYLLLSETNLAFELTNKMAIYDPKKETWTEIKPPKGWGFIGDSPWTMLADGRLLLGDKVDKRAAVLDTTTLTWTEVSTAGKRDFNAEEGWTLLPDGSVLTIDVKDHPHAERFIPNSDPTQTQWVNAGTTPGNLQATLTNADKSIPYDNGKKIYYPPGEIGPAILRPDGSVFATGAVCAATGSGPTGCQVVTTVGHTAIFDIGLGGTAPSAPWRAGPDFPNGEGAGDSFANLLPNGHVLVETNPAGTLNDALTRYSRIAKRVIHPKVAMAGLQAAATPTWHFYEFDGANLIYEPNADFIGGQASTLLLPTGEVMLNGQAVYATTGSYAPSWAPEITHAPVDVAPGGSYEIFGTQFTGLSQANAFGDEFAIATNYPLVRITNSATGDVTYARTHHFSSGVATRDKIVSTRFDVPKTIERGPSTMVVVANGIPSRPVNINVGALEASAD